MNVWVIQSGEFHHGGGVDNVYATKRAARDDFTRATQELGVTVAAETWENDEPVTASDGCDWLTLTPFEVKGS